MSVPGAAPGTKKAKAQSFAQVKPEEKAPAAAGSGSSRKPDRASHDAEVKELDEEIEQVKVKQDDLRTRISGGGSNSSVNEERQKIRAELNSLKDAQAGMKANRGKTQEQIRSMQDRMQSKIKDLNSARAKFPYKSGAEVDTKIASLEKQVESGSLKLVDERKALNEISTLRKSRKTVDSFATQQTAIEADRKAIDEAKAKLDDPEARAASDKFNDLKSQLDKLTGQADEAYKSRNKLFEQRDANKKRLDELYGKRRELKDAFRAANDAYYQKMNEDRARRAEKQKAEKAAVDDAKRQEVNERLLEEASQPAFEREIEDCSTLIEYFSRGGGKASVPAPALSTASTNSPKVPAHDLRKVDAIPEGATVLKKKGADDDSFFSGMGGGKKGRKGKKGQASAEDESGSPANQSLNLPMSTLSALLTLEVSTPLTSADIPKTIEALREKQQHLKDTQAKTTEDRIAAAKARIERATNAISKKSNGAADDTKLEATPPPTTRRTSEEPMQTSDKSASDAAQNGTDAAETSEEPTKIVNGDGEEVDAMSALS